MFGVKNAAISIKYFAARSGSGATIYINDRPVPLLAGENPEYQSPLSPMTCKVFGEYSLPGEISERLPYLAGMNGIWRRGNIIRYVLTINIHFVVVVVVVYSQKWLVTLPFFFLLCTKTKQTA